MKGPSIDAIKRFKEQQEQKKREENERKIQEKLNTLEHRSTQGDRKAKQELKKIRNKIENPPPPPPSQSSSKLHKREASKDVTNRPKSKSKSAATFNFEELMNVAKQNNNQIREKPQPKPPSPETLRIPKKKPSIQNLEPIRQPKPNREPVRTTNNRASRETQPTNRNVHQSRNIPQSRNVAQSSRNILPRSAPPPRESYPPFRNFPSHEHLMHQRRPMPSTSREEEEEDYESDGFVVSDGEDDAQAELAETLRSVFRYDRRRCDLREEELDRQYRAIGNVSTFEDLEREERRAARLAAAEDARAQREEDERKRLKKLRLEKAYKEKKR